MDRWIDGSIDRLIDGPHESAACSDDGKIDSSCHWLIICVLDRIYIRIRIQMNQSRVFRNYILCPCMHTYTQGMPDPVFLEYISACVRISACIRTAVRMRTAYPNGVHTVYFVRIGFSSVGKVVSVVSVAAKGGRVSETAQRSSYGDDPSFLPSSVSRKRSEPASRFIPIFFFFVFFFSVFLCQRATTTTAAARGRFHLSAMP
jgi:hypothetical protein